MRYKTYPNPNPNGNRLIDCISCKKRLEHHAKGLCYKCYKKQWKSPIIICKSCGRERPHKAFGLCDGCHMRLHHYNVVKTYNAKKEHGLSLEQYQKLTKKCLICGFDKVVELHHLDINKGNKDAKNLVGLCPNHHKMIHSYTYIEEIKQNLKSKGFNITNIKPSKGKIPRSNIK